MNHEEQVRTTKQLRVALDAALQTVKAMPQTEATHEATRKIQEAVMWLGMNLKTLGEANPYPQSYNPESLAIEPTAQGLTL